MRNHGAKRAAFWATSFLTIACVMTACAEETPFYIQYLLTLQGVRESAGAWLATLMQLLTALGEAVVPMLIGAVLFWSIDERAGIRILLFNAVGHVVNQFLKTTVCAYRPWIRDARVMPVPAAMTTATGYSFPSGHVTNSGAWLLGLGLFAKERCQRKSTRAWLMALCMVVWLLVGLSRNFLGVHTPQDVGVMLLLMLAIAFVGEKALVWAEKGGKREWIFAGVCAALAIALAVYASCKRYPLDYDAQGELLVDPAKMVRDTFTTAGMALGFAIGWFCARRYVHFDRKGKLLNRILRSAVGCVLLIAMELLLKTPFIALFGDLWGRFLRALLETVTILALYPLCIRAVQGRAQRQATAA